MRLLLVQLFQLLNLALLFGDLIGRLEIRQMERWNVARQGELGNAFEQSKAHLDNPFFVGRAGIAKMARQIVPPAAFALALKLLAAVRTRFLPDLHSAHTESIA